MNKKLYTMYDFFQTTFMYGKNLLPGDKTPIKHFSQNNSHKFSNARTFSRDGQADAEDDPPLFRTSSFFGLFLLFN